MLLVDANVLLYAVDEDAPLHDRSHRWLDQTLAETEPLAFTWLVLLAFLRVATHPALFAQPLTAEQAADVVEHWLAQPAALVLEAGPRHLALLRGLLVEAGTAANLVNDAHLAAVALEHGATIVSFDRDFGRFEGLRCRLPAA